MKIRIAMGIKDIEAKIILPELNTNIADAAKAIKAIMAPISLVFGINNKAPPSIWIIPKVVIIFRLNPWPVKNSNS